jgi:hypothetical protein
MKLNHVLKTLAPCLLPQALRLSRMKVLLLVTLPFLLAMPRLGAQDGWKSRYLVITPGSTNVNLAWAADPAYAYMLKSTTDLGLPFTPTQDISNNLQTQTNYISLGVPITSQARFFELFAYDTHGPQIPAI